MSETATERPALPAVPAAVATAAAPAFSQPMSFAAFAATLRPQARPRVRNGQVVMSQARTITLRSSALPRRPGPRRGVAAAKPVMDVVPGHPDEIWLKLLKLRHGTEKHDSAGWFALIDNYRGEPAHPADPRYGGNRP